MLDTIERLVREEFWIEVVTLVVPGWNDSDEELRSIARFLAGVSRAIPWHVTAFHPDYRMADRQWTPAASLLRAAEIGQAEGLHFVYAGNVPGRTGSLENTYCPACKALLIERVGFRILADHLGAAGSLSPMPGLHSGRLVLRRAGRRPGGADQDSARSSDGAGGASGTGSPARGVPGRASLQSIGGPPPDSPFSPLFSRFSFCRDWRVNSFRRFSLLCWRDFPGTCPPAG